MEQNIGVIFPSEVDRAYAELTKFRTIREINPDQLVLVDSLLDLEKKLKEQYHQNKINI